MNDQTFLIAAKERGFLIQSDKERFVYRIRIPSGVAHPEQLEALANAARAYGDGRLCMTSRFCFELPGIAPESFDEIEKNVRQAGLGHGVMGCTVRPLVCCKGSYCRFGRFDVFALMERLNQRYYGKPVPHKFKINVTGCQNNCAKVQLNDIGIMPAKEGFTVFVGGRAGRRIRLGEALRETVAEDALETVIDAILAFFQREGKPKERLAVLLERKQAEDPDFCVDRMLEAQG